MIIKPRSTWSIYTVMPRKPGRLLRYTSDEFPTRQSAIDYIGEEPTAASVWRILYNTRGAEVPELESDPAWGETSL